MSLNSETCIPVKIGIILSEKLVIAGRIARDNGKFTTNIPCFFVETSH